MQRSMSWHEEQLVLLVSALPGCDKHALQALATILLCAH